MSFILDALKRSEAERQQKNTPGIASIPEGTQHRKSSKWIWLVIALVAINLVVLGGLLFKVGQDSASVEPPTTTAMTTTTNQRTRESPTATAPPVVSDTNVSQSVVTIVEPDATVAQPRAQIAAPAASAAIEQIGTVDNGLETFNVLRAKGVLVLPDMHLDIHVYGGQPSDRFVFVNMSKYKENAIVTEGPVVSEITPDGVVLTYQGTSFLLPRE